MSVQRYYVLIVGNWFVTDGSNPPPRQYYVTEAMETINGVMVSVNPEAALARFQDLNLANEYAAWKNGQPAPQASDPTTWKIGDQALPPGTTFTGCTFSPPLERADLDLWKPPFRVERDPSDTFDRVYLVHRTEPPSKTLVRVFSPRLWGDRWRKAAAEYAASMNAEYLRDPAGTFKTAMSVIDEAAKEEKLANPAPPVP